MSAQTSKNTRGYSPSMDFKNTDERLVRVCLIGNSKLNKMVHSLLPEFREVAEFTIIDSIFADALSSAHRLIEANAVDVFISAGANAFYLKDTLPVPVVPLRVSQSDLFVAVMKASAFSRKMLLLTHEHQLTRTVDLLSYFGDIDLIHRTYSTVDEARDIFQNQKQDQFGVVIGSSFVCDLAEKAGIPYVMVYSRESCRFLIEAAITRARVERKRQEQSALADLLLSKMDAPSLLVNRKGYLIAANPSAQQLFPDLHGRKRVPLQLPTIRFGELSDQATPLTIAERDYLATGSAFVLEDELVGRLYRFKPKVALVQSGVTKPVPKLTYVSAEMHHVIRLTELYAATPSPVLLQGETGTGKELIARQIHALSPNSDGPFVAINCAAIPLDLLESELFGYAEGAFTSARSGGRTGLLEEANGGTFFMDEVNELPLTQQAKLLRMLQEKEIKPVGSNRTIPLNIKFVAACHHDLQVEVANKRFREDLYYRMNVFSIKLPALRERLDDLEPLMLYFMHTLNNHYRYDISVAHLVKDLLPIFRAYQWPGNVRQLENLVERLLVSLSIYESIPALIEALPLIAPELVAAGAVSTEEAADETAGGLLKQSEAEQIADALRRFGGNKTKAAEFLGISKTTLWRRLKEL
ncbi:MULTISPECIES: sigma 54-interacting transcriptional regulator [unclassified Pseudidiomarina]|uniref:sigma 54-interacting transcriptional regulator n=1 Tax=Pseudidiomarina salilacus TaxID=3384452 RepID=UPI0039847998